MKSLSFFPILFFLTCFLFSIRVQAQDSTFARTVEVDYNRPQVYEIGGLTVSGIKYLNPDQILSLTGIQIGDKIEIPGEELSSIIKRIWQQRWFSEIAFYIDSVSNGKVYLNLYLQERPRISMLEFEGVKSSERTELIDKLKIKRGGELSDYLEKSACDIIKKYYVDKGFLQTEVKVLKVQDTTINNAIRVTFVVDRKQKVKIQDINFNGNENIKDSKLAGSMKKTRAKSRVLNVLSSKKFNEKEYENDKKNIIKVYNEKGFRDAKIVKDSIYYVRNGRLGIDITIDEGRQYYFRNITWTGNSQYSSDALNSILRIKKGDIYDVVSMEERLTRDEKGNVSKLYTDNGYLFFNVTPVEVRIENDSVDVEMRIYEGKPAIFNRIMVRGNTVTNEKVVRRELYTRPGYLYSQSNIERSLRELASMGHFEPEKLQSADAINIVPNQQDNTVDITYNVVEKSNSQFEIAGGWGGNTFVGTLGVSFNNFSIKRIFDKRAWRPVPLGDGQQLAFRFQTNGTYYTALTASFVEPWLFGNKPTSFSFSAYYTRQTNSYYFYQNSNERMEVFGASVGLGKRLKWPDNWFVLYNELSLQSYRLHDWNYYFIFSNGTSHNFSYKITLQRNSTDQPIYPRSGSDYQIGLQLTPPYSLFRDKNTDYQNMEDSEKYKWIEYHKWTVKGTQYTALTKNLVLMTRAFFGYLGFYNRDLGYSPFEGYVLGGDGMSGYSTYGTEVIGLRGYPNSSLTPLINNAYAGNVYDKFTVELRYPLILQPQSTIYALAFLEGGNSWSDIRDFNPFSIKRSAGIGVRVLLPIVGMLGIDWGYGFDPVGTDKKGGSNFHFVIGQQF